MSENIVAIKSRIIKLVEELNYHSYQYYVLDSPKISDESYDLMFRELQNLEKQYPDLTLKESPTNKIGGDVLEGLDNRAHSLRMYSLDNMLTLEDWDDFIAKISRLLPKVSMDTLSFWLEPKMDGLAIELIYENGYLVTALTRGDGEKGEVVTETIKTIRNIPLRLISNNPPKLLEVRGEVIMLKEDFIRLNEQYEQDGKKTFANPRNAAAGSVKQLDPKIAASRPLRFYAYGTGLVNFEDKWLTQQEVMQSLQQFGLPVAPKGSLVESNKVMSWFANLSSLRNSFPFELDGGVAKVNDLNLQEALGYTARAPRFAIAFKFAAMQATTRLLNIDVQVGRTGVLTPVAILEPISVGGVTISRATLHNEDEIKSKGLEIGDMVVVQRAGDVIPEVVRPLLELRSNSTRPFVFPSLCPECGHKIYRNQGESSWRCINKLCPAVKKESLKYFVSKSGLDIKGIGSKWVDILIEKNIVSSPIDFFTLTKEKLLSLDRMGDKLAENFINSFKEAKEKTTLSMLISALGIKHVGEQTSKVLAKTFKSIDGVASATIDSLQNIQDIGPEVSSSIIEFFSDKNNKDIVEQLKELGINPTIDSTKEQDFDILVNSNFKDKRVLFTGTLKQMPRSEAEKIVESLGGTIISSVSKKLDYLVVGESPGSKLSKAESLNVTILSEDEFFKLTKSSQ